MQSQRGRREFEEVQIKISRDANDFPLRCIFKRSAARKGCFLFANKRIRRTVISYFHTHISRPSNDIIVIFKWPPDLPPVPGNDPRDADPDLHWDTRTLFCYQITGCHRSAIRTWRVVCHTKSLCCSPYTDRKGKRGRRRQSRDLNKNINKIYFIENNQGDKGRKGEGRHFWSLIKPSPPCFIECHEG